MAVFTFNPEIVTKSLVGGLKDRNRDVVLQRFALGVSPERKTLESIGQDYGITRERVRQIESFALNSIKKSESFSSAKSAFAELRNIINKKGGLMAEDDILDFPAGGEKAKNHIYFLLVLGENFTKMKEDDEFRHRWVVEKKKAEMIHQILRNLHREVSESDLIPEEEIIWKIKKYTKNILKQKISNEIARSWLNISKFMASNVFGEWGVASSASIHPRGMRDLAFLVLRKHGSPMHFTEVASAISEFFPKKAHLATVHNELIKDNRFILMGRGIYALGEWGYSPGTVREVIKNILKSEGPLQKEELINRVLKERYVKENTILVNLQNSEYFKRDHKSRYILT
ncbi:MAG TPA: hypothetical protein ENG99_01205 [bacterium]|nr:hypothetical protein [bacterium]